MFKIKIDYKTGDSFGSKYATDTVGHVWQDLSRAKESLKRIKNHYKYLSENNEYAPPSGKLPSGIEWHKEWKCYILLLVDDEGKEIIVSDFWNGYFEELYKAEIVLYNVRDGEHSDMIFEPY